MNTFVKYAGTPLIAAAMMMAGSTVSVAQSALVSNGPTLTNTAKTSTAEHQQGYNDGMTSAKNDSTVAKLYPQMNRKVDAKSSNLYVHPPLKKGADVDAYRSSFEAGYNDALAKGSSS